METLKIINSNANLCRRKIVVAQIKILRNFEERPFTQQKIVREMNKLHWLWFKGGSKYMIKIGL
jgi:hypothetical protein